MGSLLCCSPQRVGEWAERAWTGGERGEALDGRGAGCGISPLGFMTLLLLLLLLRRQVDGQRLAECVWAGGWWFGLTVTWPGDQFLRQSSCSDWSSLGVVGLQ